MRISPLALALSIVLCLPAPAVAEAPPTAPIPLGVGDSRFWLGGQIESGDLPDASLCDIAAPCPTFKLQVAPGGHRLRVAYDTPSRQNSFELDVIAPDGTVTAQQGSNVFDAEAFVAKPAAGAWTVRDVPQGVDHAFFRLRAKLEDGPDPVPAGHVPLLPNLRAVPPFELGFVAPANPLNAAYPPDTVNPPLSVAGQEPMSCTADEMAPVDAGGGGARDCLRFTSGPINVGAGPFMKTFKFATDAASGGLSADGAFIRGPAFQDILYSDGKVETRRAGTYSFHTTHAHFHDDGILTYELFRVAGDELLPAGKGTKSGFCPADQLMGQWRSFTQEKNGFFGEGDTPTGSCYGAADDGLLALTRGWGDVYRWQRPGQYVDFAGNGDGYYVVRTTVDKADTTLEIDETDNSAYAYVKITGRRVELIERGWGMSPLDPHKTVFTGFGPASQDPFGAMPAPTAQQRAAESVHRDSAPPRVRAVRVRRGRLTFVLSEPATVHVTILRGRSAVRRLTVTGDAGANVLALKLRRGRYRVVLAATDAAGNAARPASARVRR
jgi:Lysyl oxidase